MLFNANACVYNKMKNYRLLVTSAWEVLYTLLLSVCQLADLCKCNWLDLHEKMRVFVQLISLQILRVIQITAYMKNISKIRMFPFTYSWAILKIILKIKLPNFNKLLVWKPVYSKNYSLITKNSYLKLGINFSLSGILGLFKIKM